MTTEPARKARTPQDYAIEHAEYMAKKADRLLEAIEELSAAELKREEEGLNDDAVHDARDVVWEYVRALHSGIYEFRKRRDRAALAAPIQAPEPTIGDGYGPADEAAFLKRFEKNLQRFAAPIQAVASPAEPIDMVLHCPKCGLQHVDADESQTLSIGGTIESGTIKLGWDNPPHKSHLCHGCGHIWRPADVPTNGVATVKTTGKADSPIATIQAVASTSPAEPCPRGKLQQLDEGCTNRHQCWEPCGNLGNSMDHVRPGRQSLAAPAAPQPEKAQPAQSVEMGEPASPVVPMKHVSVQDALDALDSLDDYARMAIGMDAIGSRTTLKRFIAQVAATVPAKEPVTVARLRDEEAAEVFYQHIGRAWNYTLPQSRYAEAIQRATLDRASKALGVTLVLASGDAE